MKNLKVSVFNDVFTITSARIIRASGYGQYKINIDFMDADGDNYQLKYHSTDSQLFDAAHGSQNHDQIVFYSEKYAIERAIENFDHVR